MVLLLKEKDCVKNTGVEFIMLFMKDLRKTLYNKELENHMDESIHKKLRWKKFIYRGPRGRVCKKNRFRGYMEVVDIKIKN